MHGDYVDLVPVLEDWGVRRDEGFLDFGEMRCELVRAVG